MAFSTRPYADLFDPSKLPEPSAPLPPGGESPSPLPPSPAGPALAQPVAGAGGGSGLPPQLMQLLPALLGMLAGDPSGRGAFMQGFAEGQKRRLQEQQEREAFDYSKQRYEGQLEEASAERRERSAEREQSRQDRLQAAIERRLQNLQSELGAIEDPEAFKRRVASADLELMGAYGDLYEPGTLAQRAQYREPDYRPQENAIKRIIAGKSDEEAIELLKGSRFRRAAYGLGYLVDDNQGQTTLFREPEPPKPKRALEDELADPETTPARRKAILRALADIAAARREPDKPKEPEPPVSPYSRERMNRVIQSVDELIPQINRWTTGYGSVFSAIPETEARTFAAQLDTLKANVAFNELVAMREASKTGGALGQVSDREGRLLQSALGALDQAQSPADIKAQLEKVKASIQRWYAAVAGGVVEDPEENEEKTVSLAEVEAVAKRLGITVDEAKKRAAAEGYIVR